jgi:transcriptional regulator with XRE-family HTH domain
MSIVGKNIRKRRELGRMTREQLSKASNISTGHLGQIESGKKGISIEMLEGLAKALRCEASDFLKENHEENPLLRYEFTRGDDTVRLFFPAGMSEEEMSRKIKVSVSATFNIQLTETIHEPAQRRVAGGDIAESSTTTNTDGLDNYDPFKWGKPQNNQNTYNPDNDEKMPKIEVDPYS